MIGFLLGYAMGQSSAPRRYPNHGPYRLEGHTCDYVMLWATGDQFRFGWHECPGCAADGYAVKTRARVARDEERKRRGPWWRRVFGSAQTAPAASANPDDGRA